VRAACRAKYLYQRVEPGGRTDFVMRAKEALRFGVVTPKTETILVPKEFQGSVWEASCPDDVIRTIRDRFPFQNVLERPAPHSAPVDVAKDPQMLSQLGNEEAPQTEQRPPPFSSKSADVHSEADAAKLGVVEEMPDPIQNTLEVTSRGLSNVPLLEANIFQPEMTTPKPASSNTSDSSENQTEVPSSSNNQLIEHIQGFPAAVTPSPTRPKRSYYEILGSDNEDDDASNVRKLPSCENGDCMWSK
jgi:hypothetical protein